MSTSDFEFSSNTLVLVATDENSDTLAMADSIRKAGLSCVCFANFHTMEEHWRRLNPAAVIVDTAAADLFFACFPRNEVFRPLPVIQIVSSPDVGSRTKALAAGATDCIVKPVAIEELLARLRAHLNLRAA